MTSAPEKYVPRDFNRLGISHLLGTDHANLFATPGTGKTAMTLTALMQADQIEPCFPAVVFAPLRVANSVWDREIAKWSHTRDLRVAKMVGDAKTRRTALNTNADLYLINFENAAWLEQELAGKQRFRSFVIDESRRMAGCRAHIRAHPTTGALSFVRGGTKGSSAIAKMAYPARRRINRTGTPTPKGLLDLWGQQFFLDYGNALGRSFGAFTERWFRQAWGSRPEAPRWEPVGEAFEEITALIKPNTLSIDAKDWFDLKELRVVDIKVELSKDIRKRYQKAKNDAAVELLTGEMVDIANAGALTNKLLQIASGFAYDEHGEYHYLHDEKMQALDELLEELDGRPVIVTYYFKAELERLLARYPHAVALPKGARQQEVEDAWNRGEIPILLIHPQSAGHGLNLQHGGCDMVITNPHWSLEQYQQVIERIGPTRQMQAGYDRQVSIYRLLASHTADEDVISTLDGYATLQDAVMNAVMH